LQSEKIKKHFFCASKKSFFYSQRPPPQISGANLAFKPLALAKGKKQKKLFLFATPLYPDQRS
jgi:hypothetical protein